MNTTESPQTEAGRGMLVALLSAFGSAGVNVWNDADTISRTIRTIEEQAVKLHVEEQRRATAKAHAPIIRRTEDLKAEAAALWASAPGALKRFRRGG